MKTHRTIALLLFTALTLSTVLAGGSGTAETKAFTNVACGFEIRLPSDWREIPSEVVQDISTRLSARVTLLRRQPYKYGYQRASGDHWFVYPYMVVQVNEQGPMSENSFTNMLQRNDLIKKGIDKAEEQAGDMVKDAKADVSSYDTQRHMMRLAIHEQLPDGSEIQGISATFLTSRGSLSFLFYARTEDFDGFKPGFESAINSITLSPNLAYKPPPGHGNDFLFYALIGGGIGAALSLFRRKKSKIPHAGNEPPPHT